MRGEVPGRQNLAEEYSFDELVGKLARGALRRRQVPKLAGAAILGGALGVFTLRRRCRGSPPEENPRTLESHLRFPRRLALGSPFSPGCGRKMQVVAFRPTS